MAFTIFLDLSALVVAGLLLLFNRRRSKRKSKVEALLNKRKDWSVAYCDPPDCDCDPPVAYCDPPDCDCDPPDELYTEYYDVLDDDMWTNGDDQKEI